MKNINVRIKTQRKLKGLTQESLANKRGTTKAAVSRWETGRNTVSSNKLQLLADILGVDPEWLLTGELPEIVNDDCENVFFAPLYSNVYASAGSGTVSNELNVELVPIPSRFMKFQSDINKIYCVVVKGDSMSPVLYDGSIIAINSINTDIKDGRMYLIQQGDLLRVKMIQKLPNKLILQSYNGNYKDEVYDIKDTNMYILGEVFWFSSVPYN